MEDEMHIDNHYYSKSSVSDMTHRSRVTTKLCSRAAALFSGPTQLFITCSTEKQGVPNQAPPSFSLLAVQKSRAFQKHRGPGNEATSSVSQLCKSH